MWYLVFTIIGVLLLLYLNVKVFTTNYNDFGISRILTMLLNISIILGIISYKLNLNRYYITFAILILPFLFFSYYGQDIPLLFKILFGVCLLHLLKQGKRLNNM